MKKILFIISLFVVPYFICAQVGINTENPDKSSLLDVVGTNKGVLFPRVGLNSEYDMTTISDPAIGLLVYNTGENGFPYPGYVAWNGWIWVRMSSTILKAHNGLTSSDPWDGHQDVHLGGMLHFETVIFQNGNNMVFENKYGGIFKIDGIEANATIPGATPALEVVGKIKITPPGQVPGNNNRLVVNPSGEVGIETTETMQTPMAYAQSPEVQAYNINSATTTSFNSGVPIVVDFSSSDFVINNITTLDPASGEFTILNDGIYDVSGYVNYQPSSSGSNFAALNLIIQYQAVGSGTWEELSLARQIFTGQATKDITSTVVVPSAAKKMNKGDKLRMVLVKPPIGDNHGNFSTPPWGIKLPTGGKYSKSIRILAI